MGASITGWREKWRSLQGSRHLVVSKTDSCRCRHKGFWVSAISGTYFLQRLLLYHFFSHRSFHMRQISWIHLLMCCKPDTHIKWNRFFNLGFSFYLRFALQMSVACNDNTPSPPCITPSKPFLILIAFNCHPSIVDVNFCLVSFRNRLQMLLFLKTIDFQMVFAWDGRCNTNCGYRLVVSNTSEGCKVAC